LHCEEFLVFFYFLCPTLPLPPLSCPPFAFSRIDPPHLFLRSRSRFPSAMVSFFGRLFHPSIRDTPSFLAAFSRSMTPPSPHFSRGEWILCFLLCSSVFLFILSAFFSVSSPSIQFELSRTSILSPWTSFFFLFFHPFTSGSVLSDDYSCFPKIVFFYLWPAIRNFVPTFPQAFPLVPLHIVQPVFLIVF